jgi:hypothetical protein
MNSTLLETDDRSVYNITLPIAIRNLLFHAESPTVSAVFI